MAAVNCKACGTPFRPGPGEILCGECRIKEVMVFQKVRDYIRDNPGSNAEQIALGTKIDERTIVRFINQGKLFRK
jgi:uncharacterized Zn finger protein (UPF0148 family)